MQRTHTLALGNMREPMPEEEEPPPPPTAFHVIAFLTAAQGGEGGVRRNTQLRVCVCVNVCQCVRA